MATIGLGNIKIIDLENGKTGFISNETATLNYEPSVEEKEYYERILKPISFEMTIHPKRKGTMLEQSLYYNKSKKKRIRKKYDFRRKLGVKCKNYY